MDASFRKLRKDELSADQIERWNEFLLSSSNLFKMYQSPQWWEHLQKKESNSECFLISAENSKGEMIGIIPLQQIDIKTNLSFRRHEVEISTFKCLDVLGSRLLLASWDELYLQFFHWIWENFHNIDGVYFKSISTDSYEWRFLESVNWNINGSILYRYAVARNFHVLKATGTFDKYLSKQFRKKKRYNLKRQVRLLRDAALKEMEVRTYTNPEDVPDFNEHVRAISAKTWKAKILKQSVPSYVDDDADLVDIASKDLLRAYLLLLDGRPITYVLGFQYQGIYHYSDIGFDEDFASYSPGSVLLFLLIEDLLNNTDINFVNFGIGDSEYKRQFANDSVQDNSLIVLRKTLRNRTHFCLNEAIKQTKAKLKTMLEWI